MKIIHEKIASLELMRVISILAIIVIHTQLFIDFTSSDGQPWLANIVNQLSRFAVPFFFIVSGFLIAPKLLDSPLLVLRQYNLPLLRIWLVWSAICLLLPTNMHVVITEGYLSERLAYWDFLLLTPLNSMLEGGLVHLWFLPALMIAVSLIALLVYFKLMFLLLPASILLYVYGVAAGSYASISELTAPFFTRNGPFFSFLMVVLGFEIRRRDVSLSTKVSFLLLLLGVLGHFGEAYWLASKEVVFTLHDFLFFTPLWSTGIFLFLLAKPNIGDHPLTYYLSRSVLAMYVSHLSIAIVFYNVVAMLALKGLPRDLIMFFGTLFCTLLFVKLIEKTALQRYLFR